MWFQELFNTSSNRPTFIEKVTLKAYLSFHFPKYQHMQLCQVKNIMLCSVSAANWDTRAGYMEFIESFHKHLQLRHYCLGRSLREAQLWKSKRNNSILWNGTCHLFWNTVCMVKNTVCTVCGVTYCFLLNCCPFEKQRWGSQQLCSWHCQVIHLKISDRNPISISMISICSKKKLNSLLYKIAIFLNEKMFSFIRVRFSFFLLMFRQWFWTSQLPTPTRSSPCMESHQSKTFLVHLCKTQYTLNNLLSEFRLQKWCVPEMTFRIHTPRRPCFYSQLYIQSKSVIQLKISCTSNPDM